MSPIVHAVLWMTGALFSFLGMGICGRELADELSPAEIAFYRNVMCLLILVPFMLQAGAGRVVSTTMPRRHIARNLVHFAAQWGWFFGLSALPMAEVFAIEFTAPIWTALLASLFLGERLGILRALAIGLGFTGVLVILRPGLTVIHPASLVVLAASVGYAVSYILTKQLVVTETPLTILFYMNIVQLPVGLALSVSSFTVPSLDNAIWIVLIGIVGLTSHYCISKALTCADASIVVPMDFLRLPLAAVMASMIYAEALSPWVVAGVVLIFAGNWINLKSVATR